MSLVENGGVPERSASEQPPPPTGRRERRKAKTRAALLAAARELFASKGLEHTTIAEIADHADIAIDSFYNYFPTKEELLEALIEEELGRQLMALQLRQAQAPDPAEKISIAHRHLIQVARADPDWAWLFIRLEAPYRVAQTVLGRSAGIDLADGIEAGRFHLSNPQLALNASGGALFAVIHSVLVEDPGPEADCEHAEGILRAFGLDRAEAAEIARRPLPDPAGA